ncbi:MAG: FmdE family protein [Methanoregula sp.]
MTTTANKPESLPVLYDECVKFHGHSCVGLAFGYRAALAAMEALGVTRPKDEELVAICETDACGIDAIQVISGTTAGKGNLIVHDYGKHAFTFYNRRNDRAIRVFVRTMDITEHSEFSAVRSRVFGGSATESDQKRFRELTTEMISTVLTAPKEKLLEVREVRIESHHQAHIFTSITCASCGETVADAKTRMVNGRHVCIPCAEGKNLH